MDNLRPDKSAVKRKTAFILRDTPAWIDQHQSWISDGARKLYKALRSLADAKSGRLLIPGRGWIRVRTVEQKAGMSKPTRLKYMRELLALGAVSEHRDYVTRSIKGRNLKILGQAQITVLPLHAPNPHKERLSPTDKSGENANPEPQDSVSPTDKSPTDKPENGHLRTNSPTVEEVVRQDLSETTNGAAPGSASVGVPAGQPSIPKNPRGVSKAPTEKSPFADVIQTETQRLAAQLQRSLYFKMLEPYPDFEPIREYSQKDADALGIPFRDFRRMYEAAMQAATDQLRKEKQELLASLAESLFEGFWEHDDDANFTCYAFDWFELSAKELGIPPDEIDALFHQTCDAAAEECDRLLAAALKSRTASAASA